MLTKADTWSKRTWCYEIQTIDAKFTIPVSNWRKFAWHSSELLTQTCWQDTALETKNPQKLIGIFGKHSEKSS